MVAMQAHGTAQQHAVDALRTMIAGGELAPGDRVRQEEIAERVGLSVAPVREALRVLEQEGQVTYLPRRGYLVTELQLADLREIYELRALLEARAVRHALPELTDADIESIAAAARACAEAEQRGDVGAELAANRAFHLAMLDTPDRPHMARIIRQLWDSTEAYRAMYYNSAAERRVTIDAHERILGALRARDADALVAELDEHRERALAVLGPILAA